MAANSCQLQVTIKRDDYRNKTAFEYSESARKPGRRAQFFFLRSGGTHDPFNLSKIVFQSLRCRESLSKVRALFFFEGVDKKWSFVVSRQGVNFSCQNLSFLKTIAGMGNHNYTTCEKPKFNDISFTVYIINRYFFFV